MIKHGVIASGYNLILQWLNVISAVFLFFFSSRTKSLHQLRDNGNNTQSTVTVVCLSLDTPFH